jgi:hypothetical protein
MMTEISRLRIDLLYPVILLPDGSGGKAGRIAQNPGAIGIGGFGKLGNPYV